MSSSSITALTGVPAGSRAAITSSVTKTVQFPSADRRSNGFLFPTVAAAAAGGGRGGAVPAPKYKGTLMREKKLSELIEAKVKEAKEVCEEDARSDGCKVAWDEVEEISQTKADLRRKLMENHDPLESFCEENPETDECRIYED